MYRLRIGYLPLSIYADLLIIMRVLARFELLWWCMTTTLDMWKSTGSFCKVSKLVQYMSAEAYSTSVHYNGKFLFSSTHDDLRNERIDDMLSRYLEVIQ